MPACKNSGATSSSTSTFRRNTQAHRLLAANSVGQPVRYGFIGALEDAPRTFRALAARLYGKEEELPYVPHAHPDVSGVQIQAWHERIICHVYSQDFACFGYSRPATCPKARDGAANRAPAVTADVGQTSLPVHDRGLPQCILPARAEHPCAVVIAGGLNDGTGFQTSRRMRVLEVAFRSNCSYVHSPLATSPHMSKSEVEREEKYFGFGKGCPHAPVWHQQPINISNNVPDHSWPPWRASLADFSGTLHLLGGPVKVRGQVDARPVSRALAIEFRRLVRSKINPAALATSEVWAGYKSCGRIAVAMHVRYGDLATSGGPVAFGRWVPNGYYMEVAPKIVAAVAAVANGRAIDAHVASQGQEAWRKYMPRWQQVLRRAGASTVAFHIDGDPLATMHNMIEADVLVMGWSSFSATAAFYSRGIIFTSPMATRHPLLLEGSDTYMLPEAPSCTCQHRQTLTADQQRWLKGAVYMHETAHGCTLYCPDLDDVGTMARNLVGWNISSPLLMRPCP